MTRYLVAVLLLLSACVAFAKDRGALDIYFIDVEGGQATLFVSPSGKSLLIDTGWPGYDGRDADRIVAAAKQAGVSKIDTLLITHFHTDHVGGVPQLAARIPIGLFVDHGPSVEHGKDEDALFRSYVETRGKSDHLVVKPGDRVPFGDVDVRVLSSAGDLIPASQPGAGANPLCGSDKPRDPDPSENARSVGTLITFGKFRAVDLGDLTWNKELDLVCPVNRVGTVSAYIASHHGMDLSGPSTSVHAFAPRVAIVDNGSEKGGTAQAYQAMKSSPGLEDIWQLHFAVAAGDGNNAAPQFLANLQDGGGDKGYSIRLTARKDGSFTVTNLRTGWSKKYEAR